RDMHNLVGMQRIGEVIELEFYREGRKQYLPVLIQPVEIATIDGGEIHLKLDGATIGEISKQQLQRGVVKYLEVLEVEANSNAQRSGFQQGDIIYSINKQSVGSFGEAFDIVAQNDQNMIMNIQRGERELYLLLK
ncbi:MAG: serine protease Do, partial [Gammaproteobacteria bacterium]